MSDDGHCYKYIRNAMNYAEAKEYCETEDSRLIEIGSQKEQYFLRGLVGGSSVWIGIQDTGRTGHWTVWNSRAPVIYSDWLISEPNNPGIENCGEMTADGQWNDQSCLDRQYFVCERDHQFHQVSNAFHVTCRMKPARNCYTYHMESENYAAAQAICAVEGGTLGGNQQPMGTAFHTGFDWRSLCLDWFTGQRSRRQLEHVELWHSSIIFKLATGKSKQ